MDFTSDKGLSYIVSLDLQDYPVRLMGEMGQFFSLHFTAKQPEAQRSEISCPSRTGRTQTSTFYLLYNLELCFYIFHVGQRYVYVDFFT